jgi:hypothetical protein
MVRSRPSAQRVEPLASQKNLDIDTYLSSKCLSSIPMLFLSSWWLPMVSVACCHVPTTLQVLLASRGVAKTEHKF